MKPGLKRKETRSLAWPEEVIAIGKSGKQEVRLLLERGKYARYTYIHPETKKVIAEGKESIWLKPEAGQPVHLFFIPVGKRALVIKKTEQPRKVWDPKAKRAVELFE